MWCHAPAGSCSTHHGESRGELAPQQARAGGHVVLYVETPHGHYLIYSYFHQKLNLSSKKGFARPSWRSSAQHREGRSSALLVDLVF
jgi:hypothetical protein